MSVTHLTDVIDHLHDLNHLPNLGHRDTGYGVRLPQTTALLHAARLAARAEMAALELNEETDGNPIDSLLPNSAPRPALFSAITTAIMKAARQAAFGTAQTGPPPDIFHIHDRVRVLPTFHHREAHGLVGDVRYRHAAAQVEDTDYDISLPNGLGWFTIRHIHLEPA